jgi:hypothetical protein
MDFLPLLPILLALPLVLLLFMQRKPRGGIDASDQLRIVMRARFEKKRLLSRAELDLFRVVDAHLPRCGPGLRLMAQPSLGEILTSPNDEAFRCINAKRLDMLVIDTFGMPVLAIEHQGGGHYQSDAAARDAVKREALRRAGVELLEIFDHHRPPEIRALVSEAIMRSRPKVSPLSTALP